MNLPKVTIKYLNGMLGMVPTSQDGLLALVCPGQAVQKSGSDPKVTFALEQAYEMRRPADLKEYGIDESNNPCIFKAVTDFYSEAEEGTPLILFGYLKNEAKDTVSTLCAANGPLRSLITAQKGALRGIVLATEEDPGGDLVDTNALTAAQNMADWAEQDHHAPLFVILEKNDYQTANDLTDLTDKESGNHPRVGVFIGRSAAADNAEKESAIGLLAGRIAAIPVQRNIGRVKDGPLAATRMYIGSKLVDEITEEIETLYQKGYITPRTYTGKSGYFFTDDRLASSSTEDYQHLSLRRVIDKAYRIAYATMVEYLLDEIPVYEDGTMHPSLIKSWQASVENALNTQMTGKGELSADTSAGESGCVCFIDATQNVLAHSTIEMTVKVRPFGYSRLININLGFQVTSTN